MNRNLAASIRARLKQRSDTAQQDFNLTLTRFGLERLLYRLSVSTEASNFLLKGALLFSFWYDVPHRPTRDLDLLGFGPDDIESVVAVFREVCKLAVDDGIEFNPDSVKGTEIRKQGDYGGVRVDLLGLLDGARIPLQVDVGFGDAVTPAPEGVTYPVLLDDLPAPRLRAYPKYTVIAEKFQAIYVLGMANTRLKDYFDLWVLLREESLDLHMLREAIEATFSRRNTALPATLPVGLSENFVTDVAKQTQWKVFLRKNRLDAVSLDDVVHSLSTCMQRTGLV
jgi:hypothetical protein